jgi:hypothetical protein
MPTNFEIAVILLLAVNILATLYYNYHSEEDYAGPPRNKRPEGTRTETKTTKTTKTAKK